jgi:hypothetical protein
MSLWFLVPFELFLPGYAWIVFSGLKSRFGIVERLALSFIISVSFTSLFTAGLSFVTSHYLYYSVGGTLALSLILLILSFRHGNPLRRPLLKIDRTMLPVIATACIYVVILVSLFWSSPFYPTADAYDPITHAQVVEGISNGLGRTLLLHSNYAIGMHFASAVLARLLVVDSLDAIRFLLSIVIVVSVFLTYFCARSLLGNANAANFTLIAAAFIIPADAIHFIKVGTFPNILSDALVVTMLWLIVSYTTEPSRALGLTLTFLALAGLFVHSTFLLFLGALWVALPVFFVCYKRYFKNYFKSLLFTTAGLFCILVLLGSFLSATFGRIFTGYVASSFSPTPVPLILQVLVWNYLALASPLATLAIIAAIVFVLVKLRNAIWPAFVCIWFGLLFVAAIVSLQGWRFILLSLVPAGFLLGGFLGFLRELSSSSIRGLRPVIRRMLLPILLGGLILSGSFVGLLPRVFDPSSRIREEAVVDSMLWLKQNGDGQSVASVQLPLDYRYLTTLTGIAYVGDFNDSANSLVTQAGGGRFGYVAVAVQGTQFPTFESSSMVVEKYQNNVVAIFFIPA